MAELELNGTSVMTHPHLQRELWCLSGLLQVLLLGLPVGEGGLVLGVPLLGVPIGEIVGVDLTNTRNEEIRV